VRHMGENFAVENSRAQFFRLTLRYFHPFAKSAKGWGTRLRTEFFRDLLGESKAKSLCWLEINWTNYQKSSTSDFESAMLNRFWREE
jgi:hypothetical protein